MKPEKEIQKDVQSSTELELSETPNPTAIKLKPLKMKWIVLGMFAITVLFFGYSFNNFQQKVIEDNRKWAQKNKESEEFYKTFDPKSWNKNFKLRVPYREKFDSLLHSYIASLDLSEEEKKKYNLNYEPKRFQQAQQEFFELKAEYSAYQEPDFSTLVSKNVEGFKRVNDSVKEYISLMMPIWEYSFEKASNANNAKQIYLGLKNFEMSEDEMKKVCIHLKEVPNLNYDNFACK